MAIEIYWFSLYRIHGNKHTPIEVSFGYIDTLAICIIFGNKAGEEKTLSTQPTGLVKYHNQNTFQMK